MDIKKLSRIQDSTTDVLLENLKGELGLVNKGDMNFLDFLSTNEKQLVQLNAEQVNELAALAEDKQVKDLLGRAAISIKDNGVTSVSSIGSFVHSVFDKDYHVKDGSPFIEYLYAFPNTERVKVNVTPDLDGVDLWVNGDLVEFFIDNSTGELVKDMWDSEFGDSLPDKIDEEKFIEMIDKLSGRVEDAEKVQLVGDKPYSMYELINKPPKWVTDLELWEHIVEKVTEDGKKEVKIITPLAIYKRKLAKKQKAMEEVEDSFATHRYAMYLQKAGYNVSPVSVEKEKGGYLISDLDGNKVKVDDYSHALEFITEQLYDKLVNMEPKPYAEASRDEIDEWAERYAKYMVNSTLFI